MAEWDGEMRLALPGLTLERYQAVIELLAQGLTADVIGERTLVSTATVKKIRLAHPDLDKARREQLLEGLEQFVTQGATRLAREVETMDVNRLSVSLGIAIDKLQLLKGQATQRVEHNKSMSHEELIDKLKNAKKAKAKTIEIEPEK